MTSLPDITVETTALFNKIDQRGKYSLQVLLQNLQVQLEIDIILLVGKYSLLGKLSSRKTFSIIVALNV